MLINLKVKTLDAQTHEFSIDNEITVREFKDKVAEKTNIAADQQRIIYCGRVMVDDKQLKEYDVDGKVVHVAERPPPSQRLANSESSSSNTTGSANERRTRGRTGAGGMRNSPLFRALDGMVVGTMAFPVNANGNTQTPVNPLAVSSSFCMNRITVARHMLDCANNIAAYLEDPSRGLNNQSLDILARGRWTMESTVVEVGITSDIPQSQQIVEMVQGAVQAALRRSGNTNVTLVQLPPVFSSEESGTNTNNGTATATTNATTADAAEQNTPAASVIIEDIDEDDDDNTPTNEQNNSSATTQSTADDNAANEENAGSSSPAEGSDANNGDASRRRTGTRVLAGVIEQMRQVQARLNPFVDQYYALLQNDQTFEESDTNGRENAQRLFDRVSEAFHYLSHAQHAISDLMLDVSQSAPRYLTCRPILIEQSGYVSSNNFITPAMFPAALRQNQQAQRNNTTTNNTTPSTSNTTGSSTNTTAPAASTSNTSSANGADTNNATVDDPVDDPVTWPPIINFGAPTNDSNANNANDAAGRAPAQGGTLEIVLQPTRAYYLERNFQRQVARLLQNVVSAAPFDTEFHVHINSPNVVSIDVPIGAAATGAAASGTGGTNSDNAAPTTTSTGSNDNATATTANSTSSTTGNNANPARVTTATLPTTSTQTRSTSRPQVHIGNIPVLGMPPGWNGRVLPANNVSSFDRFLSCNSHHVRDHQGNANNDNTGRNTNQNNTSTSGLGSLAARNRANIITRRRNMSGILQRVRRASAARTVGSTMTDPSPNANNSASSSSSGSNLLYQLGNRNSAASSTETRRLNIHSQLMTFIENQMFKGQPINEENMSPAINRAVQWFGEALLYLPQYEKPEYNSRDSLFNILRATLPIVINLMNKNPVNLADFEQKLRKICEEFRKRLYSVLIVCIGRANADIYWGQLMRLLCVSIQSNFDGEVVEFLTLYLSPNLPTSSDENDAQQFIVHRNSTTNNSSNSVPLPMDTDEEMNEVAGTSQTEVDDEPLPNVVAGSSPWHRNFPNDWLPIITRDIQRQTENPPNQPPYSDAYISGMSSKRRKLVQHTKPPTEIRALIADSVGKAIQNAGVGSSTAANQSQTPEEIARAIANDTAVQSSCTDAIRTQVRERLEKDPDYQPEKYPKSAKFIQK
ncbi:mucin-19 [Musca vetustissima]|uniref:mucin-19 n=1 Tax=Musca vetustissima TaxID=27455 RepID=UPI002AB75CCD|nr:mucin-19 [Musca vetustissima]